MSGPQESDGRARSPKGRPGVLSNLPKTRPQRSSPRRVAARRTAKSTTSDGVHKPLRAATGKLESKANIGGATSRSGQGPSASAGKRTSKNAAEHSPAARKPAAAPAARTRKKADARSSTRKPLESVAKPMSKSSVHARSPARISGKPAPRSSGRRRAADRDLSPVPRQGFASEGDRATGAVQPPAGTELASGAAGILGDLAKAGFSSGERVLRGVFSRLPGI